MKTLEITASATSSEHDFDFLIGNWKILNRKLDSRMNDCDKWTEFEAKHKFKKILNGFGNTESFTTESDGRAFEAITLRLFNPKTRLWSIYWADSNAVVLDVGQVGSFSNGIGEFFARDFFEEVPIIVKFKWDATKPEKPVWSQAFSADEGKTWEWNWYMYFSRED